jgi:D-sedoheptulose 7-phosphate isomerase
MKKLVTDELLSHQKVTEAVIKSLSAQIEQACSMTCQVILSQKKIILFGNGGSAADAQHIAAEFTGRFVKERKGLPVIAITTDTSALTAIGNDFGYERIFERQVEAIANSGDMLVGISTSGNSKNVINALKLGKLMGCRTLGLSGNDGGLMNACCDLTIVIPSVITARIQEMHILIGHILCRSVDNVF